MRADLTVSGINLTPLIDGQLTFNVTVSDSLGNVGTSATNANLSRTTLTLDSPAYTDANDTQFGFTLNNTTATSYTWVLILSGSPTNVRGSGQIAAGSLPLHVGPVDISSLASGNYLLHVILTEANSSGHAANQTLSLNHSVPAFSIVPNVPYINASTAANAGFAFVGAESNSTCTYTVTDSRGTSISSSTAITVNTPTQNVGGINVSTLADGTLTYNVTLTDFFGNTLTEQATAVLDRVAPTGYSLSRSAVGDQYRLRTERWLHHQQSRRRERRHLRLHHHERPVNEDGHRQRHDRRHRAVRHGRGRLLAARQYAELQRDLDRQGGQRGRCHGTAYRAAQYGRAQRLLDPG